MSLATILRLFVVFILGFSSGLPFALLGTTLQAWYADVGMSVMQVGLLSLLGLPYTYRMFFAPLVDRYPLFRLGRRRSWMMLTQLILLLGLNFLAWFEPNTAPGKMAIIALILSFFSAAQDVVIDAQRIEYLEEVNYGLGAALAVLGYRIAILLGAGIALILSAHLGWAWTYRLLGSLMSLGFIAAWSSQEPNASPPGEGWHAWVEPFRNLITRKNWAWLLAFILLFKLGEAFTTTTSGLVMPFLRQSLDFSIETIGYVNKIMGVIALLLGGLIAGLVLRRASLFSSLLYFGLLQAFSNLLFLALAFKGKVMWLLITAVFADNLVAGMGATALVALLMHVVDKRYTATQFSILVAISAVPRIFAGPIGAWIQMHIGWAGLFECAFVLSFLYLPALWKLRFEVNLSTPVSK